MPGAILGAYRAPSGALSWRVTANAVTETVTAIVTSGREYWTAGDGMVDSAAGNGDLLILFRDALLTHSELSSVSVTLQGGRLRIVANVALSILWTDPATTAEAWVWGWPGTSNSESAATLEAPNTMPLVWLATEEVSFDSKSRDVLPRGFRTAWGGQPYVSDFGDGAKRRAFSFQFQPQTVALEEYAQGTATAFETLLRRSLSKGRRFRLYLDATTVETGAEFSTYWSERLPTLEQNQQWAWTWDVRVQAREAGLDTMGLSETLWTPATGGYVSVTPANYVALEDPTTLNGRAALTLSFWLRGSTADGGDAPYLSRAGWASVTQRGALPNIAMTWLPGERTQTGGEPVDSQWHNWTVTWDAGDVRWYLDGSEDTATVVAGAAPGVLPTVTADLNIGGPTSPTHTFDLARLAIWGAVATPTQVADLFLARGDLADGGDLTLGQPLIWAPLNSTVVGGSVGGTLTPLGSPAFTVGA